MEDDGGKPGQRGQVCAATQQRLHLERSHDLGVRQVAKNQGIHGSQIIKQSCGAEVGELGGLWVLRRWPGIVQKLEL